MIEYFQNCSEYVQFADILSNCIALNFGIIKTSQPTANRLGNCRLTHLNQKSQHYEYNTNSGAANPPELLHLSEWGCGMKEILPGYVYLIHAVGTNRYKIGRSINLQTRIQQLQRQSPYLLKIALAFKTSNPLWDEAYWQDCYKDYRIHGEWFEFDEKYYENTVRLCFWSRHEESKITDLAKILAKSQGIDWEGLEEFHPDKSRYFDEASSYLGLEPYSTTTYLEV